jgi:hypothetical protein
MSEITIIIAIDEVPNLLINDIMQIHHFFNAYLTFLLREKKYNSSQKYIEQ